MTVKNMEFIICVWTVIPDRQPRGNQLIWLVTATLDNIQRATKTEQLL